jgi:hypothetical protein
MGKTLFTTKGEFMKHDEFIYGQLKDQETFSRKEVYNLMCLTYTLKGEAGAKFYKNSIKEQYFNQKLYDDIFMAEIIL